MTDTENNKNSNSPALRFPGFTEPWKLLPLSQIAPLQRGFDLPTDKVTDGNFPIVYSNGIIRHHNEYKCVAPGVITGRSGTIGKFTFIPTGYYWPHNTSLWVTDFCGNSPLFVYYLYQSINIELYATGSGVPTLNRNDVHRHKTAIPDYNEQEKIAKFLQLLDDRIATQRRLIEDLEKLKSSINETLYAMLTTDYMTSFNEIGSDYGGLTGKSAKDFGEGKPFITYLNIYQNQIITDCKFDYVEISDDENQNKVRKGDLLFTLSSETPEGTGYAAVYLGDANELYLNSFCFGIHIPESEMVYPPYMGYLTSTSYFRRKIIPYAQGSIRFNLHKPSLMSMRFSLPTKENQIKIFNTLRLIVEKISVEKEILSNFTQQKDYLLSKLFI